MYACPRRSASILSVKPSQAAKPVHPIRPRAKKAISQTCDKSNMCTSGSSNSGLSKTSKACLTNNMEPIMVAACSVPLAMRRRKSRFLVDERMAGNRFIQTPSQRLTGSVACTPGIYKGIERRWAVPVRPCGRPEGHKCLLLHGWPMVMT